MTIELTAIMFLLLTLGLAALPFVPAITEWRRKRDVEPLRVLRDSQVDVRHFAIGFRKYVESTFGPMPECWDELEKSGEGTLEDGQPFVLLSKNKIPGQRVGLAPNASFHRLILSHGDLQLPRRSTFMTEIYVDGSVSVGEETVIRAILVEKDIDLGPESTLLRWLHGGRSLNARSGCVLFGRVSADDHIRIASNCRFERLNAPRIDFYHEVGKATTSVTGTQGRRGKQSLLRRSDVSNRIEITAGRWLVFGDLEIPEGKIVEDDLVVTGRLEVAEGVRVSASLKSRKEMRFERGVEVAGNVVSERDITIGEDCRIRGLVLSERTITIHHGTWVGTKKHPTTVSGDNVFIEPGVRMHGTVWAHVEGRVIGPESERSGGNGHETIQSR